MSQFIKDTYISEKNYQSVHNLQDGKNVFRLLQLQSCQQIF